MMTMRAWVSSEYGKPSSVLKFETQPMPHPAAGEVLVRVICSSLNPIDLRMIQGYGARLRRLAAPHEFPYVSGRDVVGEVVEVGASAHKFKVGDKVVGITGIRETGSYAEFTAIAETNLISAPDNIASNELAALAFVGLTTWSALVGRLKLDPENAAGKHLFVHAGSGGVGSFAIQWAKTLGMKVSTTCGPSNVEWVSALGADAVVNYAESDFRHEVQDVDFAYDTLGGEYEAGTSALVKRGGGYVSIVHQLMPYTDQYGLVLGGLRVAGRVLQRKFTHGLKGRKYAWSVCQASEAGLEHIFARVADGRIKAVIDKDLAIADLLEGFEHLETGRAKGKIVLTWD